MPDTAPTTARARLADARVYLCTDARRDQGDLPEFLDAVLAGGVDIVQLRDKGMEAAEELEHLAVLADACARHGKLLAVNDRADVAHAARADVLHLGQGDLPVPAARAVLGADVLVGRSTHAESEAAAAAAQEGVDYFCTGPCWPTPTKPGRHAPGLDLVRYTAALGTDRPLVRHRRHRPRQPRRGAGGGRPARGRGPRDHRGRGPGRSGGRVRQAAAGGGAGPGSSRTEPRGAARSRTGRTEPRAGRVSKRWTTTRQ
ncbi:Thiamine-phosphate synthase [Streptomyces cyaneofuscatus]